MDYYTYMYIDPITNVPFYVGKGHDARAYEHWRQGTRNKRFNNRLIGMRKRGIEPIIQITECADEQAAFDLERKLIAEYGRKDLGNGPLYNCTDGGEGFAGGIGLRGGLNPSKRPDVKAKQRAYWTPERKRQKALAVSGNRNKRGKPEKPSAKKRATVMCQCGHQGNRINMNRWHFQNCRLVPYNG